MASSLGTLPPRFYGFRYACLPDCRLAGGGFSFALLPSAVATTCSPEMANSSLAVSGFLHGREGHVLSRFLGRHAEAADRRK